MSNNREIIFKLLRLDGQCSIVVYNDYPDVVIPEKFKESEVSIITFSPLSKEPISFEKEGMKFKLNIDKKLHKCLVPWEAIIGLKGIDTSVEFGLIANTNVQENLTVFH